MPLRSLGLVMPSSYVMPPGSVPDSRLMRIQKEMTKSLKKLKDFRRNSLEAITSLPSQMDFQNKLPKALTLKKIKDLTRHQMQAISMDKLQSNFQSKFPTDLLSKTMKELSRYRLSVSIVDQLKAAEETRQEAVKQVSLEQAMLLEPKPVRKEDWVTFEKLEVPIHRIPRFYGLGEFNINKFSEETGLQLILLENGVFCVISRTPETTEEARDTIETLLIKKEKDPELEYNGIYTARIVELIDAGVMVKLYPTMPPTLLRNAELGCGIVHNRKAWSLGLKTGQEIEVTYLGRDPATGNMKLSRRAANIIKN